MPTKKIDALTLEISSGDRKVIKKIDLMDLGVGWDIQDAEHAEELAQLKTELTGELHIAVDMGRGCHPKHRVTRVPAVGDEVSYSFNGDSYPAGKVAKISKTLKVVTLEDGSKYYRFRQTGSWKRGCWTLIEGYHNERNPHF